MPTNKSLYYIESNKCTENDIKFYSSKIYIFLSMLDFNNNKKWLKKQNKNYIVKDIYCV